jgi:hypothetical protein
MLMGNFANTLLAAAAAVFKTQGSDYKQFKKQ